MSSNTTSHTTTTTASGATPQDVTSDTPTSLDCVEDDEEEDADISRIVAEIEARHNNDVSNQDIGKKTPAKKMTSKKNKRSDHRDEKNAVDGVVHPLTKKHRANRAAALSKEASEGTFDDQLKTHTAGIRMASIEISKHIALVNERFKQDELALQEKQKAFEASKEAWYISQTMLGHLVHANDIVKLNFRGTIFMVNRQTLLADETSMFYAMFCGRWSEKVQPDGSYFIDRSPHGVHLIIQFLAYELDSERIAKLSNDEKSYMRYHADFFNLTKLLAILNGKSTPLVHNTTDNGSNMVSSRFFSFASKIPINHTSENLSECCIKDDNSDSSSEEEDDDSDDDSKYVTLTDEFHFKSHNRIAIHTSILRNIASVQQALLPGQTIVFKSYESSMQFGFIVFKNHTQAWAKTAESEYDNASGMSVFLTDFTSHANCSNIDHINMIDNARFADITMRKTKVVTGIASDNIIRISRNADGTMLTLQRSLDLISVNIPEGCHLHAMIKFNHKYDMAEIL